MKVGAVIITNNIKVAAICFLGGFAAGVPTAFFLAANGWMLGTIAAAVHHGGYDLAFWPLIVPHGVLELSILIIAGAAGLCLEAYVSPSGIPAWSKLLVGASIGAALYSWLLLAGRHRRAPAVHLDRAAADGPSVLPA